MNDKYLKEIAKELRLIRIELQKINKTPERISVERPSVVATGTLKESIKTNKAGDRVTIK